jgi:transposase-like protein
MSETPNAKKLPSPQERLELILLGLARRESATALCKQAGVSRELFYRWMRAVREAGLKALAAKAPGPKLIEAEKAPKEALRLRERVARLEKELKAMRKDRDHQNLVATTAQRIIRRNAWGMVPEPKVKKNGMRNLRRGSFMSESGRRNESMEPRPVSLPSAGELPEARTGDGSADAGAPPEKRS